MDAAIKRNTVDHRRPIRRDLKVSRKVRELFSLQSLCWTLHCHLLNVCTRYTVRPRRLEEPQGCAKLMLHCMSVSEGKFSISIFLFLKGDFLCLARQILVKLKIDVPLKAVYIDLIYFWFLCQAIKFMNPAGTIWYYTQVAFNGVLSKFAFFRERWWRN